MRTTFSPINFAGKKIRVAISQERKTSPLSRIADSVKAVVKDAKDKFELVQPTERPDVRIDVTNNGVTAHYGNLTIPAGENNASGKRVDTTLPVELSEPVKGPGKKRRPSDSLRRFMTELHKDVNPDRS